MIIKYIKIYTKKKKNIEEAKETKKEVEFFFRFFPYKKIQ